MQMAEQQKISDLDLLVEFTDDKSITLLDAIHFKHNFTDELRTSVDLVWFPLTEKA